MKLLIAGVVLVGLAGAAQAQYGMNQQMSPPWTNYSPVFPGYQQAPTIGGFQQTYQQPVYQPPTTSYQPSYPSYLAPGANSLSR